MKSLIMPDEGTKDLVIQLLGFNIGIELGQILFVTGFLLISSLFLKLLPEKRKYWIITMSLIAASISIKLLWETKFW
ncbi:MAG: HupE/UreJ family protein [Bacteroidota bacterium]